MPSIVSPQPDSARHHCYPAPAASRLQSAYLGRLVDRVADKDRAAFADLYDALSPQLLGEIRAASTCAARAVAILSATFVEVWMLARFHASADDDVEAWIADITIRRTMNRRFDEHAPVAERAAGSVVSPRRPNWSSAATDSYDRQYVLCLAALLDRPHLASLEPEPARR
jgi:hypothetical protein